MAEELTLMTALMRKVDWTDQNHKVIAGNIAHADTPNRAAQKLEAVDFSDLLKNSASPLPMRNSGMTATNPAHITSGSDSASHTKAKTKNSKTTYEVSPAGNSIVLEEQVMMLGQNMAEREMALNIYKKQADFLKESTK